MTTDNDRGQPAERAYSEPMNRRHDSALREALIGVLATVGPFFGVRYQPPRVEIPVVMSPAPDDLDPAKAGSADARHGSGGGEPPDA